MFTLVSLVNILYFSLLIFDFFEKITLQKCCHGPSEGAPLGWGPSEGAPLGWRPWCLSIISIIVDPPLLPYILYNILNVHIYDTCYCFTQYYYVILVFPWILLMYWMFGTNRLRLSGLTDNAPCPPLARPLPAPLTPPSGKIAISIIERKRN